MFGIVVKPRSRSLLTQKDLRTKPATFLGAEILITRRRKPNEEGFKLTAQWRQIIAKQEAAKAVYRKFFPDPDPQVEAL